MSKKQFYITTPIYYVNDKPHIGHAYTTITADVFARFWRLKLGKENVFFLTGTDEHGSKVQKAAETAGLSPKEFTDKVVNEYLDVWKLLNISNDEFIRTTDPRHEKIVSDFLVKLFDRGYIYKGVYKGLYCVGCERFYAPEETKNEFCIYHPDIKLTEQKEENYFFKLKEFSSKVLSALEKDEYKVLPSQRKNEIVGKIKQGINDISISRAGVSWGIPLTWDKSQTIYVWIDALLNYYSATKIFDGKEKFWPAQLHLMAKDILWFHALILEAILIANEVSLPEVVYAHGFFTIDGQKMSKSIGNVIDPKDLVNEYGVDGTRYLLLTAFSFGYDGDISLSKFKEKYNADLANGLGNLVSSIAMLSEGVELGHSMSKWTSNVQISAEIGEYIEQYKPDEALKFIWSNIKKLDHSIAKDEPWKLTEEEKLKLVPEYLKKIVDIALDLRVFLPDTAEKILNIFTSGEVKKPEPLFMRKPQ